MTGRLRKLHSDESGFTLTELLTTLAIGTILLLAAFMTLDRATSASQEIADRQDALQRGRVAMESIVRQLRSQVCLGDETEPITVANDDAVTFYVDLSDGGAEGDEVEQRTIRYEPSSKTIFQDVYTGEGDYPLLTFDGPPRTRELVSNVEPITEAGVARPVLRYYAFPEDGSGDPGELELLPTPLSADDAIRTIMVKVGFAVLPDRRNADNRRATTLESDIYVRLADPSRPAEGPRCV
jgi:prepilin-type N-terminal cleavage/methylation domain-containing protein